MSFPVTVGVPVQDRGDLDEIRGAFDEPPVELESRPFDGAVFAQVVGVLGTGGASVLIAWIKARAEARQHMSISAHGIEATGYTAKELGPVLDLLKLEAPDGDGA